MDHSNGIQLACFGVFSWQGTLWNMVMAENKLGSGYLAGGGRYSRCISHHAAVSLGRRTVRTGMQDNGYSFYEQSGGLRASGARVWRAVLPCQRNCSRHRLCDGGDQYGHVSGKYRGILGHHAPDRSGKEQMVVSYARRHVCLFAVHARYGQLLQPGLCDIVPVCLYAVFLAAAGVDPAVCGSAVCLLYEGTGDRFLWSIMCGIGGRGDRTAAEYKGY